LPHTCRSLYPSGSAQLGGYLPVAPGVSTDRYPIPQQTFKDVATVQSVTDETCQKRPFNNLRCGTEVSLT
jgi:hypothetical protein